MSEPSTYDFAATLNLPSVLSTVMETEMNLVPFSEDKNFAQGLRLGTVKYTTGGQTDYQFFATMQLNYKGDFDANSILQQWVSYLHWDDTR